VDEIHPVDGKIVKGYGGVYYNTVIMSCLLKNRGEIFLITKIGEDIYDDFKEKMINLNNVNTDYLIKVNQKNNRVKLKYTDRFRRKEYSKHVLPPVDFEEIDFSRNFDILLINFISGRELKWETFKKIRKEYQGIIYLDVHSLLMGFKSNGERYLKKRGNWNKWIKLVNIVQMNKFEAESIAKKKFKSDGDVVDFAMKSLDGYTDISIVTLGERGAIIVFKEKDGLHWEKINAFIYNDSSHSTGCGDAFSSGFVVNYLDTYDPVKSSTYASKVAGFNASLDSSEQLQKFKNMTF